MLKFIRKYQMLILVVGGTLLMVVFLLEPIISRLAPSPEAARAATIGPDGRKVTRGDLARAAEDVNALERFLPVLTQANMLALDRANPARHWLLLRTEARSQGFIGEPEDGETWLPELSVLAAQGEYVARLRQQYGPQVTPQLAQMFMNTPQGRQELEQLAVEIRPILSQRLDNLTGTVRGGTRERMSQILADARGILRMVNYYQRTPRLSEREAVIEAKAALDSVVIDYVPLAAAPLAASMPEPGQAELDAFFDRYRATNPAESDLGVGYVLPARVKLAVLTIDAQALSDAIAIDRVEISKRAQQTLGKPAGSLTDDERDTIEREYVADRVRSLMIEADRFLRAEVGTLTRGLPRDRGYARLPEGWTPPSLDDLALRIQRSVSESVGVEFPLPLVRVFDDRFLTPQQLRDLPRLGQSAFQIGARSLPFPFLPNVVREIEPNTMLSVQVGLPVADAAAAESDGSRHYVMVLDARPTGPAESIDEAGRDRVISDFREVRAYESLLARRDELLAVARAEGLDAAATAAGTPATAAQNVTVQRDGVTDGRVDTPAFRERVLAAADALDPFAQPRSADPSVGYLAVETPNARSLVLVRLVAARPLSAEQFARVGPIAASRAMVEQISASPNFVQDYPFSLQTLTQRLGFKMLAGEADDEPAAPAGNAPETPAAG